MRPPARKLTVDGVEYVRKDLVPVGIQKNQIMREYKVTAFGHDNAGLTNFLRIQGLGGRYKSVRYKAGQVIFIVAYRPERKKRERTADTGNPTPNAGV